MSLPTPPPAVPLSSGVTPGSGSATGGTAVVITGSGFHRGRPPWISARPPAVFQVLDDDTLLATAPAGARQRLSTSR